MGLLEEIFGKRQGLMTVSDPNHHSFSSMIQAQHAHNHHLHNQLQNVQFNQYPSQMMHQQAQQGVNNGNWPTASQIHSSPFTGAGTAGGGGASSSGAILTTSGSGGTCGKPLENAGVKFGEIIGWRMWTLRENYLGSYSADYVWAPEESMTGNPTESNNEGIWAFKDKHRAIKKMLEESYRPSKHNVFGSVKLWGNVIEYEFGYRAQFGKILSIDDISGSNSKDEVKAGIKILKDLREKYKLT